MNLESFKRIIQGDAPGSVKFLLLLLLMLSSWVGVYLINNMTRQAQTVLTTQQGRFHTLLILANEYKSLPSKTQASTDSNVDVASVFAQVSERMRLGSRVTRITPDGRNQSVEINRLYAEELADLQRQLSSRGVRFIAMEMRALPAGSERLFTISAIIGPVS